jgi:hypothetical protein
MVTRQTTGKKIHLPKSTEQSLAQWIVHPQLRSPFLLYVALSKELVGGCPEKVYLQSGKTASIPFVETQSKSLTDLFPLDLEYQVRVAEIEFFFLNWGRVVDRELLRVTAEPRRLREGDGDWS